MMVLTHVTALTYFVEYMTKFGGQNYIDFFMAIEGFNASVDHQFQGLAQGPQGGVDRAEIVETIQEAALFIYHQFLSQEAITRVPIDESITNKFLFRMRSGDSPDIWFELVQEKVFCIKCQFFIKHCFRIDR